MYKYSDSPEKIRGLGYGIVKNNSDNSKHLETAIT